MKLLVLEPIPAPSVEPRNNLVTKGADDYEIKEEFDGIPDIYYDT